MSSVLRGSKYVTDVKDSLDYLGTMLKRADKVADEAGETVKVAGNAAGVLHSIARNLGADYMSPAKMAEGKMKSLEGERYKRKFGNSYIYKNGREVPFGEGVKDLVATLQVRGEACTSPLKKLSEKLSKAIEPWADRKVYLTKAERTNIATYLEAAKAVFADYQAAEAAVDQARTTEVQAHLAGIIAKGPK